MVSDQTAQEIRGALERTPVDGTGKKCRDLALAAPLAMKTGTAAFIDKKRKKLVGEGGSWTLASDSVTGVVMATRVRYASGHPFAPNGGDSAILVVRHFLEAYRGGKSS
jgi:cell division protein FtsI/penicillin-binding protein 2